MNSLSALVARVELTEIRKTIAKIHGRHIRTRFVDPQADHKTYLDGRQIPGSPMLLQMQRHFPVATHSSTDTCGTFAADSTTMAFSR